MQSLARHAHRRLWPAPDLVNFPSASTLSHCISLYLSHFAPWLPIVNSPRGNLIVDKSAPLLLKSLTVIGSVYAHDETKRLGEPLAELVRRDLLFIVSRVLEPCLPQCEHDHRYTYDVGVVQCTLLQAFFSQYQLCHSFRAEISRATVVAAARQMHLLSGGSSALKYAQRSGASAEDQDRALKQDHRRARLGWSVFLLDAQMAMQGHPSHIILADIDVALPTYVPEVCPPSFPRTMALVLDGQTPKLDDVALSCVAYALYQIAISSQKYRGYSPDTGSTTLARLASHSLNLPSSALLMSVPALSYHLAMRDITKLAKTAAGLGSKSQTHVATEALGNLREPREVRRAFANAGMLFVLGARFIYECVGAQQTLTAALQLSQCGCSTLHWCCRQYSIMRQACSTYLPDHRHLQSRR